MNSLDILVGPLSFVRNRIAHITNSYNEQVHIMNTFKIFFKSFCMKNTAHITNKQNF